MPNKREYPYDPAVLDHLRVMHARHDQINCRPLTTLELLMQEAPGWEGRTGLTPITVTLEMREALADAIDSLPAADRYLTEQLLVQGNSLRKLGYVLGIPKTSLARRRDKIRRRLMDQLVETDVVRRWLRA